MADRKFESSNDGKDAVERASGDNAKDLELEDMLDRQLDLDPDREGLDAEAKRLSSAREPDIRIEDKKEDVKPVETSDDRLSRALTAIDSLQNEIAQLRSQPVHTDRREPDVLEMAEILPGLRLPKDVNKWPIKLTDEMLLNLGWNDEKRGPAHVLNTLANALYMFSLETIPDATGAALNMQNQQRDLQTRTINEFFGLYPHLKSHADIVKIVEDRERIKGNSSRLNGKYGKAYFDELGMMGEEYIANIRGVSVEQYRASARSNRSSNRSTTTSRAVTTSHGTRGSVRKTSEDDEINSTDLDPW